MIEAVNKQLEYRNTTLTSYGYDTSNNIEYRFNAQGFRNDYDFDADPQIIFAGGSLSFGIGVAESDRYSSILSSDLGLHKWDISYAGEYYENATIYQTLLQLTKCNQVPLIIQWVSQNRNTKNKTADYIKNIDALFPNAVHIMYDGTAVDEGEFLITNPVWLDSVADNSHPGAKTHWGLAKFLRTHI